MLGKSTGRANYRRMVKSAQKPTLSLKPKPYVSPTEYLKSTASKPKPRVRRGRGA